MKKEDFKCGMIFESETYPQFDFVIDGVTYDRQSSDDYNDCICWTRINKKAFNDFICKKKGYNTMEELFANGKNTFPYAWSGSGKPKAIKEMIKKYNMKQTRMNDRKSKINKDDEYEFCSWLEEG